MTHHDRSRAGLLVGSFRAGARIEAHAIHFARLFFL
jgi:hypothetical protein